MSGHYKLLKKKEEKRKKKKKEESKNSFGFTIPFSLFFIK